MCRQEIRAALAEENQAGGFEVRRAHHVIVVMKQGS
jgi:hypothetical protein